MIARDGSDAAAYRQFLPDLTTPRFTIMKRQNAQEYAQVFKAKGNPPWLHGLYKHWMSLLEEPFKGITNDGKHYYDARRRVVRQSNLDDRPRSAWTLPPAR
jgi:hypothetical protein